MSNEVEFMINRFPTHKDKIIESYEKNDDFKSLCEDFYLSALVLQNQKKKYIKDKKSQLEYQKLFLELETEVLHYLGLTLK